MCVVTSMGPNYIYMHVCTRISEEKTVNDGHGVIVLLHINKGI